MLVNMLTGSLEQGLAYALMALGVFLTFRILSFPDLTVDGSFPLGAAISARLILGGTHPLLAMLTAVFLGMLAGLFTGILHTRLKIAGLLAGIITMTALYSINLRIMGRSNLALLRQPSILTIAQDWGLSRTGATLLCFGLVVLLIKVLLDYFLHTELGLALRATGNNPRMIKSLGVAPRKMIILGLALANGLAALSGALVAQYQGFADIGMGIGMIIVGLASVIIGESIVRNKKIVFATSGVILGSILYRTLISTALRLGFSPTDLKLVTAFLVIIPLARPKKGWLQGLKKITFPGKEAG